MWLPFVGGQLREVRKPQWRRTRIDGVEAFYSPRCDKFYWSIPGTGEASRPVYESIEAAMEAADMAFSYDLRRDREKAMANA